MAGSDTNNPDKPKEADPVSQVADEPVRKFGNFVDENLRVLRIGTLAVLACGTVAVAHFHFRLFTKFTKVKDIPTEFFRKNVKLRGTVQRRRQEDNTLYIEHIPAINMSRFTKSALLPDSNLLRVSMIGLSLTESGEKWVDEQLVNRKVWFRLLETSSDDELPAIITHRTKYGLVRRNINLLLVSKGMARVRSPNKNSNSNTVSEVDCSSDVVFPHSMPSRALYTKLLNDLVKAENIASRKGRGDWTKLTWSEWFKEKLFFLKNKKK